MMFGVCEERNTQRILDYFHSLGELGREMNPSARIGQTLASTVSAMVDVFGLEHAVLLSAHGSDGRLLPVAAYGLSVESLPPIELPEPLQQALIRKPQLWPLHSLGMEIAGLLTPPGNGPLAEEHSAAIPLVTGGELVGLFLFEHAAGLPALAKRDGEILCGMCQNIAVYLYNQIVLTRLTEKHRELDELCTHIKEIYRQAVMAFLTAIDIKDGYTKQHSLRVAQMAAVLARELHFSEHEIEGVYFAGLLHDIGKILVDKDILTKTGGLDLTEYAAMSEHTRLGAEILSHIEFPWENLIYAIRHHHDRPAYDEFAPPRPNRNLDLCNKIIGLIDAFDAMTSDRPYRRALSLRGCFNELVRGLCIQFDPETTRAFLQTLLRDLDRPECQRRVLTDRLLRADPQPVREALAEALFQVEQFMGIITTY